MPRADLIFEADRQMTICNACRYCEGFCAVFPAMELRRTFTKDDIVYFANLCFDCRACYYACPYTPPHEYAVNIPQVFAEIRVETYREAATPRLLARLLQGSKALVAAVTVGLVVLILGLIVLTRGTAALFEVRDADFFAVVPYYAMVIPATVLSVYWLLVLAAGGVRFWREVGGTAKQKVSPGALVRAARDAFGLVYLRGGGDGCPYPDELPSMSRRWCHHLVFYGFLLDFASTSVAASYHHLLGWEAPYPIVSLPVILGTVGGVMLVAGAAGMLLLKWRSDRDPAHGPMLSLDVVFIGLLLATALTGLALLALRETAAMGTLLAVHLGTVAGLFITLPYGKFAHVVYRYAALVKNQVEAASDSGG